MKKRLTDRTLQTLKAAPTGSRYDVMDTDVRGFGVRVDDQGRKAFVLITRYPGSSNPSRRVVGEYGVMTLADAREKAREWRKLIAAGTDPRTEEDRQKRAELRRQENSFASVAEAYFADIKRRKLRRAWEVEHEMRREFAAWFKRPITDISRADVLSVVEAALARDAPWQAHHVLSYASRIFNWAIERGTYGLDHSPCERMRPAKIIGLKEPRTRVLTDEELRALWHAKLPYPLGPLVQLLLLTGQRRTEVAEARWGEFDFDRALWLIPQARMKAGAAHVVPLVPDAIAVLDALPRFEHGDHLFSTTFGAKAINGFSKGKQLIDKAMSKQLGHPVSPWVLHDCRRTMRTHLSALPVPDLVRELVIGHTKKGLHRVYDQYAYLDEKRHALELWSARLRSIVTPPPANVVPLRVDR
jgi:integrase